MRFLQIFVLASCFSGLVSAASVLGTAAPLGSGSRVAPASIVTGGAYDDGFTVAWDISFNGSFYLYEYTFSGFDFRGVPAISHFIMDVSDSCNDPVSNRTVCISNFTTNGLDPDFEWDDDFGPGPSNPGFPAGFSINGVKINIDEPDDTKDLTVSFESQRAPMWGNMYFKGGSSSYAYNTGLAAPDSMNVLDFIPVVDTVGGPVVPEPGSVVLLLSGVAGLAFAHFRRSRA
jgi:hypothetical protein